MSPEYKASSFSAVMSHPLREYYASRLSLMAHSLSLMPRQASERWLDRVGGPAAAALPLSMVTAGVNRPSWHYLDRHGKMLRPLICCILLEALGKKPEDFRALLGMIELMEGATISFDDIVDGSPLRRGGCATHEKYGVPVAYAASQALYNQAWRVLFDGSLPIPKESRLEILDTLAREIFAYGFGQCEELDWSRKRKIVSEEQYLQMTYNRVVFLSFNGPVRIGALLGGCRGPRLKKMVEFSTWLGMAYHLHGDELNLFPRSGDWGKAAADDIPSGRVTLLFLHAYRHTRGPARRALTKPFGKSRASSREISAAVRIIRDSGAVERNRMYIERFRRRALRRLDGAGLPGRWRGLLADCLEFMSRSRPL